jgi:hypothetical protein
LSEKALLGWSVILVLRKGAVQNRNVDDLRIARSIRKLNVKG